MSKHGQNVYMFLKRGTTHGTDQPMVIPPAQMDKNQGLCQVKPYKLEALPAGIPPIPLSETMSLSLLDPNVQQQQQLEEHPDVPSGVACLYDK